MTERFTKWATLVGSYRPIIIQSLVVVALVAFLVAVFAGMVSSDSSVAVRWPVGVAAGAMVTVPFVLLRTRQLKQAAATCFLEVDAQGLVARYGGTTRTLTWQRQRFAVRPSSRL